MNLIPMGRFERDASDRGGGKQERLKAPVQLEWVSENGDRDRASAANLILYPKYPEVRLSGILKGLRSENPSAVIASRRPGRWLFLGVGPGMNIVAYAADPESECSRWADARSISAPPRGVFHEFVRTSDTSDSDIRAALRTVSQQGWIPSKRLDADGIVHPCNTENCGGYTLEAELGIRPNGRAEPDFFGWEVKQFAVANLLNPRGGPVTLLTPEPDGGLYKERGVAAFLHRFGRPNTRGIAGRIDFSGIHRVGHRQPSTGLMMQLCGWDMATGRITDVDGGIQLLDNSLEPVASWSYRALIEHWKRKHAKAVYVPSERRLDPRMYRFGPRVLAGTGTDFSLVLTALSAGTVYYDPGIKLESHNGKVTTKRRSQFRIHFRDIATLYRATEWWELAG